MRRFFFLDLTKFAFDLIQLVVVDENLIKGIPKRYGLGKSIVIVELSTFHAGNLGDFPRISTPRHEPTQPVDDPAQPFLPVEQGVVVVGRR